MWDKVLKALCAVAGAVAGFFGAWPVALTILLAMMTVDYATGLVVAANGKSPKSETGKLSSKAGFAGLLKKGIILTVVLVATLLDKAVGNASMVFQTATIFYYIANEGLSILENADLMGVPFPDFIRSRLETMRDEKTKPPDHGA